VREYMGQQVNSGQNTDRDTVSDRTQTWTIGHGDIGAKRSITMQTGLKCRDTEVKRSTVHSIHEGTDLDR